MRDEWDVLNSWEMGRWPQEEHTRVVRERVGRPILRCIRDLSREQAAPDAIATGGQKLTSALLQLIARLQGCRVFLAPDREEGEPPVIWRIFDRTEPDQRTDKALELLDVP